MYGTPLLKIDRRYRQQEYSLHDLVEVWRLAEEVGFDTIFTSDHSFPIPR